MKAYHSTGDGIAIRFDDICLAGGRRTAFGKYCGTLARVSPTDLGVFAARGAMDTTGVNPGQIDQVVTANIGQSSCDAYFLPRHIALYAGVPVQVPSLMVQRICGSGFETLITAAEQITLGKAGTVLCVGTENMSLSPTVSFGNRMGYSLGQPVFRDMLWEALDDTAAGYPMGYTAENVAVRYGITREECDAFALESFRRAAEATSRGFFAGEMTPVNSVTFEREGLSPRKVRLQPGVRDFMNDEQIRPTSPSALAALRPVFKDVGVLTPGNCSGIVDGAAAAVVTRVDAAKRWDLKPMARVLGGASCGIDPKFMGLGPVPAIRLLLRHLDMTLADVGLIEINEAFSAQVIGCQRELSLDPAILNVNGGAIALGHPLAATGVRLTLTLAREMIARRVEFGIASACIGGGQGTAVLVQNMNL